MKGHIDMTNNDQDRESKIRELQQLYGKYRGLRALLLTRVSTPHQSHNAQERVIRELLIEPLALQLDDERHIVHDTYTGLEYRYRAALDDILLMAERREFDVLCLDVLDRGLGRKAVSREVFRGQLRELGIHILSTEKDDHSDDDSLEGQVIRFMHGYKAEKEVKDLVRRGKNGRRDKALGNPEKGIPPKVIGNGTRPYGFKYGRDAKGRVETLEPNYDVVLVDKKGVVWTEVRVVIFLFRCAQCRIPIRQIAKRLNDIGIPAPYISIGKKYTSSGVEAETLLWQPSTVNRMLKNTTYSGRLVVNGLHTMKVPGMKSPRRVKTPPEEHIIVPVPALVSVEMQEEVTKNLQHNQQFSMRNNKQKIPALLRSGLAKCGNCGRTAVPIKRMENLKGGQKEYIYYVCRTQTGNTLYQCPGCYINAAIVDDAAWKRALEIIQDPSIVDKALAERKAEDPTASRRKQIDKKLAENRTKQRNLRKNHMRASEERELDRETIEEYTLRMKQLKQEEQQYTSELLDDEKIHREWEKAQQELERLHKKCATMQEKLKNPTYVPDYKDKRDMIEFFGITAVIWERGHINPETDEPERFKIQAKFGDIVLHTPSSACVGEEVRDSKKLPPLPKNIEGTRV